ncbi:MAG: sigma factor [Candidatus Levybacteria bacterium]|nr:sigma factor [Candidatus Levybacteria bacterium]
MRIQFYNQKYIRDILGKAKTTNISGLDWQDVAQELDIILWKNLNKFQGRNNASERTFVIKILRNKILDLAKSSNRQKRRIDSYHLVFSQLEATEEGSALLDLARPVL